MSQSDVTSFDVSSSSKLTNSSSSRPSSAVDRGRNTARTSRSKSSKKSNSPKGNLRSGTGATRTTTPGYVDKRDRPKPPTGRGSTGVTAERPLPPSFKGDETFCTNDQGHIIKFRTNVKPGPHDSRETWRSSAGSYSKRPTEEEWNTHRCRGKNLWTNRRLEWIERDRQTLAESRGNSTPASVGTSLPDVVFDVMARTDQDLLSAGRSSSECRSVSLEHRKRSISIESTSRARS